MHRLSVGVIVTVLVLMSLATGQDVPRNMLDGSSVRSRAEAIVPQFIHYDGSIPETAVTQSGAIGMAFAIYDATEGSAPLWIETQNVVVDSSHHYSVVLGNARASGIPSDLFATGEPRWLGVTLEGGRELPRVALVSVPYAMKAADAESLGGKPASAYLLAPPVWSTGDAAVIPNARLVGTPTSPDSNLISGTGNYIAKFTSGVDLGNSGIYEDPITGNIGIGTTNPVVKVLINGQLMLRGQITHAVQLEGAASSGRLGQDALGFFFSSDTPDKTVRFLSKTGAGPLTTRMSILGNGKIGIGTQNPSNLLSVAGTVESTTGGFKFPDGSTLTSATNLSTASFTGSSVTQVVNVIQNGAGSALLTFTGVPSALRGDSSTSNGYASGVFGTSSSYLGFGVTGINYSDCPLPAVSDCNAIGVFGVSAQAESGVGVWGEAEANTGDTIGVYGRSSADFGTGVFGHAANSVSGDGVGVYGYSEAPLGTGVWGQSIASSGGTVGVYGSVQSNSNTASAGVFDAPAGANILLGHVGTTSFTKVFRVDSAGRGYFNGGTQTSGADFAESVSVSGSQSNYEPGDVLEIDPAGERSFRLSDEAYSAAIAGVYSTRPGVLATTHSDGDAALIREVPLAIVGIVPCKVTAENGAIHAGDLLVTSSRPGHAMKGTDRNRMLGAILGKAVGQLESGTGVIEILVSLQ